MGINLCDIGLGNGFLGLAPKAQVTKETSKDIIKKVKRQPTEWENIFANHISDKWLGWRICEEPLQCNNKKTNNPILKWAKNVIDISPKKVYKWPVVTWKFQHHSSRGKITIRYHFIPSRMARIKKVDRASLVVQRLRIWLPMQGTRVRALAREDPTCRRATKPVRHNYWACALEPASHNYWNPRT